MNKNGKIKVVIIVLAVLLVLSIAALVGTMIYSKLNASKPSSVEVPNNVISSESSASDTSDTGDGAETADCSNGMGGVGGTVGNGNAGSVVNAPSGGSASHEDNADGKKALALELYNKQPQDNTAFSVSNMFPGDSETGYFRVNVSYHGDIILHFGTDIHPGSEKLGEVLRSKIVLLTTGEELYDGLMSEMPESLPYRMSSDESVTDELYYEITAYLDTSVGNEYQDKGLAADFKWWVEGKENLDDAPQTGDDMIPIIFAASAGLCAACVILIMVLRRKRDEKNA